MNSPNVTTAFALVCVHRDELEFNSTLSRFYAARFQNCLISVFRVKLLNVDLCFESHLIHVSFERIVVAVRINIPHFSFILFYSVVRMIHSSSSRRG